MARFINPPNIAPPLGAYTHAVDAPGDARWLHISGQVGIAPDGSVPDDFAAQANQAWKNLIAILEGGEVVRLPQPTEKPGTGPVLVGTGPEMAKIFQVVELTRWLPSVRFRRRLVDCLSFAGR